MVHELRTHEVLTQYPALLRGNLVFLGNHGGFSGARLWRLDTSAGAYCLKAWPPDWRSPDELAWIHGLIASANSLPWMPRIAPAGRAESFVVSQGRLWELATWMPGRADFADAPSPARLEAACSALALLHQAWMPSAVRHGVCPAIQRRWDAWLTWQHLLQSGWQPAPQPLDPHASIAADLWRLVLERAADVPRLLTPWLGRAVPIQPCVCDLWHDHVLFTGDAVSGLIDFGSVKDDHVAVDLARLLGSLVGDNAALWETGMSAYQRIRPLGADEYALARDLDCTGAIIAATNWLRWLYFEKRQFDHPVAVQKRLKHIVGRLERM